MNTGRENENIGFHLIGEMFDHIFIEHTGSAVDSSVIGKKIERRGKGWSGA